MITTDNPKTIALLATLTIAFGFEHGLTGLAYVRLVDASGALVASDLLGYVAEEGDDTVIYFPNVFGDFTDEAGRGADALMALGSADVQARVDELAYYAADDVRVRREYLAS